MLLASPAGPLPPSSFSSDANELLRQRDWTRIINIFSWPPPFVRRWRDPRENLLFRGPWMVHIHSKVFRLLPTTNEWIMGVIKPTAPTLSPHPPPLRLPPTICIRPIPPSTWWSIVQTPALHWLETFSGPWETIGRMCHWRASYCVYPCHACNSCHPTATLPFQRVKLPVDSFIFPSKIDTLSEMLAFYHSPIVLSTTKNARKLLIGRKKDRKLHPLLVLEYLCCVPSAPALYI